MNKYVEALERLMLHVDYNNDSYDYQQFEDDCKIVEEGFDKIQEKIEEQKKVLNIIKEKCAVLETTNISVLTPEEALLLEEYLR